MCTLYYNNRTTNTHSIQENGFILVLEGKELRMKEVQSLQMKKLDHCVTVKT